MCDIYMCVLLWNSCYNVSSTSTTLVQSVTNFRRSGIMFIYLCMNKRQIGLSGIPPEQIRTNSIY